MNEWIELNWIHTVRVRCAYKIDERRRYLLSVEIEENILHGENGCSASNGERAYAIYSMCLKGVWSHSQSIRDKNKLLHSYVYSTHIALSLLDSGNAITLTLSTQQKKKKKKKRKSIRAVSIMNNRNWLNRCKIKKNTPLNVIVIAPCIYDEVRIAWASPMIQIDWNEILAFVKERGWSFDQKECQDE